MDKKNFTTEEKSDTIKLTENWDSLDETAQKNIKSAHKAKQSGFISEAQYQKNVTINKGTSLGENALKPAPVKASNYEAPAGKAHPPSEPLEKVRIQKLVGIDEYMKPNRDSNKLGKLKEKKPEDYYNFTGDSHIDNKRQKELWGAKTDFSLTNYENNYKMLNNEEKTLFTIKMQDHLNQNGYTDKEGFRLKSDGILGEKTAGALKSYKRDHFKEIPTEQPNKLEESKYQKYSDNVKLSGGTPKGNARNISTSTEIGASGKSNELKRQELTRLNNELFLATINSPNVVAANNGKKSSEFSKLIDVVLDLKGQYINAASDRERLLISEKAWLAKAMLLTSAEARDPGGPILELVEEATNYDNSGVLDYEGSYKKWHDVKTFSEQLAGKNHKANILWSVNQQKGVSKDLYDAFSLEIARRIDDLYNHGKPIEIYSPFNKNLLVYSTNERDYKYQGFYSNAEDWL